MLEGLKRCGQRQHLCTGAGGMPPISMGYAHPKILKFSHSEMAFSAISEHC